MTAISSADEGLAAFGAPVTVPADAPVDAPADAPFVRTGKNRFPAGGAGVRGVGFGGVGAGGIFFSSGA